MGLKVAKQAGQSAAAIAVVGLLVLAAFALLPGATADRTPILDVTLPSPREGTSAVTIPEGILLFGGSDGGRLSEILLYDPVTERLHERNAELPTGRSSTAAVYDGTHVYLFGGWTAQGYSDEILRYDPQADQLETLETTLPTPRSHMAAGFDGEKIYLFGGRTDCNPCDSDKILRYDPQTDQLETLETTLPTPRSALTAATSGNTIVLFGGVSQTPHERYDDILHFDLQTETLKPSSDRLPQPRSHTSSIAIGAYIYILGGRACAADACDDIYAYDLEDETVTTKQLRLAGPRSLTGAAAYDGHGYIFGGTGDTRSDQILRLSPSGAGQPIIGAPHIEQIDDLITRARDTITVPVSAHDPRGEEIFLDASQKPPGATFTDNEDGTGQLRWTPTDDQAGEHSLVIRASTESRTSSERFTVTVNPFDAPRINKIWDRTIQENDRLSIIIEASDHDKRPITLDLTPLPDHATFQDLGEGQGHLQWDTQFGQQGVYTFTVTATADAVTSTERFTVTVQHVPQAPQILPLEPITTVIGKVGQRLIETTHPEDEPVALSASKLPNGATFSDQGDGTGILTWAPQERQLGEHEITIRAQTETRSTSERLTLSAIREHDYRIDAQDQIHVDMTPSETRMFLSDVTNTGNQTLQIEFSGYFLQTKDNDWSMTPPDPITLEPGTTETVALAVHAGQQATGAMVRMEALARDNNDPDRIDPIDRRTNWLVDVPVVINLELENREPSLLEAVTQGIQGTVTLHWADGSPAIGVPVHLEHEQDLTSGILSTTYTGQTGSGGTYSFAWDIEPTTITPGDHLIIATALRGDRQDHTATTYTVTL